MGTVMDRVPAMTGPVNRGGTPTARSPVQLMTGLA
jgi:hypothetical protein